MKPARLLPLVALACSGCVFADRHSVAAPAQPLGPRPIDIGPIVDEHGFDLGPVVAERMRERQLGDARVAAVPGQAPYYTGRIVAASSELGNSGWSNAGVPLLVFGGIGTYVGAIVIIVGAANPMDDFSRSTQDDLFTAGGVMLPIGVLMLGGGLVLELVPPGGRHEATISADLEVSHGGEISAFHLHDEAAVLNEWSRPEEAGGPLLDGIANGIAADAISGGASPASSAPEPAAPSTEP